MPSDLEKEFHQLMLDLYWATGKALGYWANYYLRKVRRVGGLQTAKDLLKPTPGIAPGLERLAREHRLDLSVEQIVLQERWRPLFTEAELKVARDRLAELPKY
jgi:5-methylcytosine-specific restriction protein A